jgi:hypothetical protein
VLIRLVSEKGDGMEWNVEEWLLRDVGGRHNNIGIFINAAVIIFLGCLVVLLIVPFFINITFFLLFDCNNFYKIKKNSFFCIFENV